MTPIAFHAGLTEERWRKLSLFGQLGNIGSEVGRALRARETGNEERMNSAMDRMLDLFDATIADPKNRGRLKELCRAREVVCDFFFGDNDYCSTAESLDQYFMAYAIAARS